MPRAMWDELGGLDESFGLPGGGLSNHDLYRRAVRARGRAARRPARRGDVPPDPRRRRDFEALRLGRDARRVRRIARPAVSRHPATSACMSAPCRPRRCRSSRTPRTGPTTRTGAASSEHEHRAIDLSARSRARRPNRPDPPPTAGGVAATPGLSQIRADCNAEIERNSAAISLDVVTVVDTPRSRQVKTGNLPEGGPSGMEITGGWE